jgi:hypothetical protein
VNLAETHDLLILVAAYDNRRFDDATVLAWQQVLADLPYADCRAAAVTHFASADAYLMPVHIRRGAHEVDRERRRVAREAREQTEQLAIEADPTRRDRSDDVRRLIAELRDSLPDGDPDKLRRPEWLEVDRRRETNAEPNPHYDPTALDRARQMVDALDAVPERTTPT